MRLCLNMLIFTHNLGNWLINLHCICRSDVLCDSEGRTWSS